MKLKDVKMEDLKELINLYKYFGADFESAFMLALEMVV